MYSGVARKVKSRDEIVELVGPRPRERKVIMCHGTFDIVHPGHLRHLTYAKEKADILVASVTADIHVSKGIHRPYVPQELRAANLAALEMVDYVVIDHNATPIENILAIQPDFFAKGFEYQATTIPARTREEMAALDTYGGQMVFTPGDVVYSSSALLEHHAPQLGIDKLLAVMGSEKLGFGDIRAALSDVNQIRVHVIGDLIVDRYAYCSLLGQSSKYPSFSVRVDETNTYVGGAGIVAKHLKSLGADVRLTTVVGDDELKAFALTDLETAGVCIEPIVDPGRPTTLKERFIADGHRMLQVDRLDNQILSDKLRREVAGSIASHNCDVVVFSDFRHGMFHPATMPDLLDEIPQGALRAADSQVSNRWGNILDFKGFDLITPNEREARFALGEQDLGVRPLAQRLYQLAQARYLILKLGPRGILTYRSDGWEPREFFVLDSFAEDVVDTIGAGDALLAMSILTLASTRNIVTASILGNIAAAVACERTGNVPVTTMDIEGKLQAVERAARGT